MTPEQQIRSEIERVVTKLKDATERESGGIVAGSMLVMFVLVSRGCGMSLTEALEGVSKAWHDPRLEKYT